MIRVENITKSYGNVKVLKDVSFISEKPEVISIVGSSGAGKTTLLQIMGTLLKPDSGTVEIDGINPFRLGMKELAKFRNSRIGFVFQFHHLLPEFTALENVMIPRLISGDSRSSAEKDAAALLEELGLGHRKNHKPESMSGGEQQRVAIARALINSPGTIFADEPSGNLDSINKNEIHRLFLRLRESRGVTVILVTHDKEMAALGDRTITMKDGQILL